MLVALEQPHQARLRPGVRRNPELIGLNVLDVGLDKDRADRGGDRFGVATGTRVSMLRRKCTRALREVVSLRPTRLRPSALAMSGERHVVDRV